MQLAGKPQEKKLLQIVLGPTASRSGSAFLTVVRLEFD
jgi:hypothetical protein